MITTTLEQKRVSREARELLVLTSLVILMTVVVVDVTMFNYYSIVKIRFFELDFGLQSRIVDPSRVESIDKESIFGLDNTTNR